MSIQCWACCSKLTSQLSMHFTWGLLPVEAFLSHSLSFLSCSMATLLKQQNWKRKEIKELRHCLIKSTLHHVPFRQYPEFIMISEKKIWHMRWSAFSCCALFVFLKHSTYLCFNNTSCIKNENSSLATDVKEIIFRTISPFIRTGANDKQITEETALKSGLSLAVIITVTSSFFQHLISGQLLTVTLLTSHFLSICDHLLLGQQILLVLVTFHLPHVAWPDLGSSTGAVAHVLFSFGSDLWLVCLLDWLFIGDEFVVQWGRAAHLFPLQLPSATQTRNIYPSKKVQLRLYRLFFSE